MVFITLPDFNTKLRSYNLQKMIDEDSTILDLAELTAISQVKEYLFERYDTGAIFSASGVARHAYLVSSIINIIIYDLHERLPNRAAPKMVEDRYNTSLAWLVDVRDGKNASDLPRKIDPITNSPKTLFRGGSVKAKSHL